MHLTLFIPDLLPPGNADSAIASDNAAPLLRHMLGRGALQRFPAIDAEVWLCQAFEVEPREDWPVAALTAEVDGIDIGTDCWLRADPVFLQLQRHGTRVLAAPALTLSNEETTALVAALNTHFSSDGITLTAPHPTRWYIRQSEPPGITAPTLGAVAGRSLPSAPFNGPRASHWHRVLTEAQMVLHEHPVNQARETRGLPAVNSLLLWGGGHKPAVPGRHFPEIWSDDPLATALAVQSGAEIRAAPTGAALWFGARPKPGSRHLITLDRVHHAARYGSIDAWLRAIEALDELWFGPLWGALGTTLQELVIVATGPDLCLRSTLRPADKMKFWKRTPRWATLTGSGA